MELFSNQPTLFVGDFNAKSSFWSSEDEEDNTNERGHWFLDKIISHEYSLLNDPSEGPTFESNIGSSYIDLSFASAAFFKIFDYKWNIAQSLRSDSDHHTIVINIMLKTQLQSSFTESDNLSRLFPQLTHISEIQNLDLNKTNFNELSFELSKHLPISKNFKNDKDIDDFVCDWINAKHLSIVNSTPKNTISDTKPYWWDKEVESIHKRKTYHCDKRSMSRLKKLGKTIKINESFIINLYDPKSSSCGKSYVKMLNIIMIFHTKLSLTKYNGSNRLVKFNFRMVNTPKLLMNPHLQC